MSNTALLSRAAVPLHEIASQSERNQREAKDQLHRDETERAFADREPVPPLFKPAQIDGGHRYMTEAADGDTRINVFVYRSDRGELHLSLSTGPNYTSLRISEHVARALALELVAAADVLRGAA